MQPGSVVAGRYRIDSELGQGGMGAVYRATHMELARPVALKMVRPDLLHLDVGLARFRREAELAQKLEHPNTVRLYDYGQTEQGLPYIAFELLRGTPLDRALYEGGAMPPARVARIVAQVLKSLMEAHGLGIVHRDIKPGNVFLCEFSGEQDFVKVLDFGIAKTTDTRTLVTQAGLSPGTPNYMAPELLRGDTLTPAADLYAVGLMMAEMLSGRLVFSGSPTDIAMEQISSRPVPLPASLTTSPLWPVLARATEKDVARRYTSAAEMLRELEAIVRSGALETRFASFQPELATAPTMPLQTAAPRRSSLLPVLIAAAVLLAIGAATAFVMFRRSSEPDPVAADDDAPKKNKKTANADDKDDDDKSPANTALVKKRFQKLGWSVVNESTTKQPTLTVFTFVAKKGSMMVTLYLYDTNDESTATSIQSSLKAKGSATKRMGARLYWLMTMPADDALAKSLVSDLAS